MTVDDGNGGSDSDNVSVIVQKAIANRAPLADAGLSQRAEQNITLTLNGTGSFDPDGDSLVFSWNQTSGKPVSLNDETSSKPMFDAPVVSETEQLTFVPTVSDGNLTSTDSVDIFVNPPTDSNTVSSTPAYKNDDPSNTKEDSGVTSDDPVGKDPKNTDGDQGHEGHHEDRKHKIK